MDLSSYITKTFTVFENLIAENETLKLLAQENTNFKDVPLNKQRNS
jgi:hypothetical protein